MAAIERKPYMDRIDRLKQRVLKTKPEMDLENAIILTKGFQESEGQPLCIRKMKHMHLRNSAWRKL